MISGTALAADGDGPAPVLAVPPFLGQMPAKNDAKPVSITAQAPTPSIASPASPGDVNSITQVAVKQGVLSCAARLNQVTNFLTASSYSAAYVFTPTSPADQHLATLSMEIQGKEGPSAYASVSVAPNQASGCDAVYDAVAYWPQNCDVVASKVLNGFTKNKILQQDITIYESNAGTTRLFLMKAGQGCVSIKKEMVQ